MSGHHAAIMSARLRDTELIGDAELWFDLSVDDSYTLSGSDLDTLTNLANDTVWDAADLPVGGTAPAFSATALGGALPGLVLDGTGDGFVNDDPATSLFLGNTEHTVYIVGQTDTADRLHVLFGFSASPGTASGGYGTTSNNAGELVSLCTRDNGTQINVDATATTYDTSPTVFTYKKTTANIAGYVDTGSANPSAAQNKATFTPTRLGLGCQPRATLERNWLGKISEVRVYPGAHDDTLRGEIIAHLMTKWNI
jgi:hypothetical protein